VQHGLGLVLDLRAALDDAATPGDQPPQHTRALVGHPHHGDQPGGQQLGQHAGVEAVGLDLRVADRAQPLGMRQHHLGDMWRHDAGDRQRVARGLQHHAVGRRQARREQLQPVASRRDPTRRPRPTALADRDLAQVAMDI
jgi:hypothetical protein